MSDDNQDKSENRKELFSAIKWICIAIVVLVIGFAAHKMYRVVAAPVEVVGNAAEGMSNAVKSGTGAVADTTSDIYNRLEIAAPNQKKLGKASDAAFKVLVNLPVTEAAGVKDGVMRMRHLGGNAGQVCALSVDFGAGELKVFAAADNDAYATSKSLGSSDDRLIRMVVITEKDDVAFNTGWDADQKTWQMKWKATTVKKEISDEVAATLIMDILKAIRSDC